MLSKHTRLFAASASLACIALAAATGALAQSNTQAQSVYVEQAPTGQSTAAQAPAQIEDQSSKVYFPDAITPDSVARARSAQSQQLPASDAPQEEVAQLSDGNSSQALAQLSAAERQVLLEAVEGTDICDRGSDIPALQELCARRIETRSADFAQADSGSAEDSLLGGGLDSERVATLEAAINRLSRNTGNSNNFSNQVIASVALGNQTLSDSQATDAEGDPNGELSQETQALVAAIVQQLGGN
ncbi:hypothetical protein [uncultured Erythrobacter sp.]|uniref:hypothetical protein n=1 Tax=uncultured Erythrobacter sp. TaxID=263913 RepID=UPI00260F95BF|nr:hypothetical protein [uncultured Erythrobacter sp.]